MRPIVSATDQERKAIERVLDRQLKETGDLDPKELARRIKLDRKHPARPFVELDRNRAALLHLVEACRRIINYIRVEYVDPSGEKIDASKYIGVPVSEFNTKKGREVLYEDVRAYQEDSRNEFLVYERAKEEFVELCNKWYHNRLARSMCKRIRKIVMEDNRGGDS